MTMILDGSSGVTFPNSTVQASAGSVLQVVNATTSTNNSTTSSTFVASNLSALITPKFASSKILAIFTGSAYTQNNLSEGHLTIARNGTNLGTNAGFVDIYNGAAAGVFSTAMSTLDSPATTSATTYAIYFRVDGGTINFPINSGNCTLTLMEIAA